MRILLIRYAARDISRDVLGRQFSRHEPQTGERRFVDAIHTEGSPVLAASVPRHQIPAASGVHQAMRLNQALTRRPVLSVIAEAQTVTVAAGAGNQGKYRGMNRGTG